MVEIITNNELDITDTGLQKEIIKWVKDSWEECKKGEIKAQKNLSELAKEISPIENEEKLQRIKDLELEDIYIVGSYARGTAKKGESDLDIMIVTNVGKNTKFVHNSADIQNCIGEEWINAPDSMKEWFDGADILRTNHEGDRPWIKLLRFSDESREGRAKEGRKGVYNLIDEQFIPQKELMNKVEGNNN